VLIFNDCCLTSYLKIFQTDLRQIFSVCTSIAVDDQSEISFSMPQGTLPWYPIFVAFIRMTDSLDAGG